MATCLLSFCLKNISLVRLTSKSARLHFFIALVSLPVNQLYLAHTQESWYHFFAEITLACSTLRAENFLSSCFLDGYVVPCQTTQEAIRALGILRRASGLNYTPLTLFVDFQKTLSCSLGSLAECLSYLLYFRS